MAYSIRAGLMVLVMAAGTAFAEPPKPVGTPADVAAITRVTEDFQAALKSKDAVKLSSLMLHSNILWSSPASDQQVATMRRETDPNFDGVRAGGFNDFVQFIKREKKPVEERFYNVKITQDRDIAWVMFDYEFVLDGAVQNYGVETWQMVKRGGQWKIFAVTWSTNFTDK